jgi:membrane protease YdiL (CAAX protease family)
MKRQRAVLGVLLVVYALLAAAAIGLAPAEQFSSPGGGAAAPPPMLPRWQLALANAAIVVVVYGLFGLAGGWFARRLQIPWMYREAAGWKSLVMWPLLLGLAVGAVLVIADRLVSSMAGSPGFPHPAFPLSLVASGAAAIGEEILFRGFVMGL